MDKRNLSILLGLIPSLSAEELVEERRKEIEREKEKYNT